MFRFRLARVLNYRRIRQEQVERDVRHQHQRLQHEAAQLSALHAEGQQLDTSLSSSQGRLLVGAEVQRRWRYFQQLSQRITAQQAVVETASKALASSRQGLLEARQQTQILEKLRDRAQQQYVRERTYREQRLLDEGAVMRSHYGS